MAPALERAGISTEPDPEMLQVAEALRPRLRGGTWEDFMTSVVNVTDQFLLLYRRIGELTPADARRRSSSSRTRSLWAISPGRAGRRHGDLARSGHLAHMR